MVLLGIFDVIQNGGQDEILDSHKLGFYLKLKFIEKKEIEIFTGRVLHYVTIKHFATFTSILYGFIFFTKNAKNTQIRSCKLEQNFDISAAYYTFNLPRESRSK